MKILQINKYLKVVGGAETYMFQLSESLQERGHEVKYWGMEDKDNLVSDFSELEAKNIDYSSQKLISKISSVIDTLYSKSNRQKIIKVLETFKPDIVHIHNYNFQLTPSILPEFKKRGIKVVQTVHDSQMVCPYHRLYNFQKGEICTKCVKGSFANCIKDRCFDGSLLKSTVGAVESMFYHSSGYYEKYIDTYIAPSRFLANLIKTRINKKIEVIPNFTRFTTDNFSNNKPNDYYLYYGRISAEKGILELIEIFKDLNLVIIGKGPLSNLVQERVSNYSNINFIGAKYGEELFDYVKRAKFVIQPSKWFENCPMTVIESFSLGTPVIASNHSGFKDLIQEGITGHLLNFNERDKAYKKIKQIDENYSKALSDNVIDFYNKNLSEKIHIEKILMVYNNLLEQL